MKYGLILSMLCLGACSSKSPVEKEKPAKKDDVEKVAEVLPDKMPIKEILLSETGVGRLGIASTFKLETVQSAFGDYEVVASERIIKGRTEQIILVKDKGIDILEISSNDDKRITEILAKNSQVNNQLGARVGETFGSIFPNPDDANCVMGDDDLDYTYACAVPRVRNVRYRFETNEKGKITADGDWILTTLEWRRY